ncbi:MAG: kynureninase [Cyclobacteriaceae bacterium]|nr:kynureninase [Cyclobacteriaceae bacterium]
MQHINSLEYAQSLDEKDPLKSFREKFHIPTHQGKDALYFTGNSLGLQPKETAKLINEELELWKQRGVEGHFEGERPWFHYHKFAKESLAKIVGAKPEEVVPMNSLTTNLHLLMVSFYRPTPKRFKIITEAGAFPSDQYALESQVKFHGLTPKETIIEITPREGETTIRTEDILTAIETNAEELALVMFSGVQYFTGQFFDIETITNAGHKVGAIVGFDLAHAAGNVPLQLHNHQVDFAVWCHYKYLNSGPGSVAGAFVHKKHANNPDLPRFAGWWGHNEEERFLMKKGFKPMSGVDGWQLSNVNVLSTAALLASLAVVDKAGFNQMRVKSIQLTAFLEFLLNDLFSKEELVILTPSDSHQRGAQLSISLVNNGREVFDRLTEQGVVADWREPNVSARLAGLPIRQAGVIRVAPTPLYNSYKEVFKFVQLLRKAID